MAQRVMIAMALSQSPELLIADEPTTALDVTIQAQILDLIRDLKDRSKTAVVLISHDLGVIAEMADKVAVMYAGQIVEEADVKTLFADPHHPYTRGLIGSIPTFGDVREELDVIPGLYQRSSTSPTLAALPRVALLASRTTWISAPKRFPNSSKLVRITRPGASSTPRQSHEQTNW